MRALLLLAAACGGSAPRVAGAELPVACRAKGEPDERTVEICVGWVLDRLLMTQVWKEHPDREVAAYVGAVGLRVAAAAGRDLDVGFRVVVDDDPQGWSLPGGYVYVTHGAVANLSSEAELAALLAHEVAHIAAGHGDDLLAPGGSATSDADTLLSALDHERDEERQADELAVGYLEAAGYRPHAVASMLVALDQAPDDPDNPDEHPALVARVARILLVAHGRSGGILAEQRFRDRTASLRRAP